MPFKTPDFWYKKSIFATIAQTILTPLSYLYQIGHILNTKCQVTKAVDIPVICVGNITAGGSGKTPTVIAINKLINSNTLFYSPCFLTRGYDAKNTTTRFISDHEPMNDTGDEPKILLKYCKTIISKNRYNGAKMAHTSGHDLIIMDDGYQNHTLKKDISFLIIDGTTRFGNQKTLPAGPLREPVQNGINTADAIILIGDDNTNSLTKISDKKPVFKAQINATTNNIDKSQNYIAFCGLAHPDKFFNTLNSEGINVIQTKSFADHHPYTENEIIHLINTAKQQNARLITTEKDAVKIDKKFHDDITILYIDLLFENEKQVLEFLKNRLSSYIENT